MSLIYISLTVGFFGLTLALVGFSEKLRAGGA